MRQIRNDESDCQSNGTDSPAARLVALFAEQIEVAVDEAFREIDGLSRAVLDSARHANALLAAVKGQKGNAGPEGGRRTEAHSYALQEAARAASMRLQFADRLQQRLANVSINLVGFARLMQSTDLPTTDANWSAYLEAARSTFTMEQERRMFDAVFDASVPSADTEPALDASQGPILFDGEVRNES